MNARWDVLGFGAVAVDDLVYVEHYPPPDSKMPVQSEQRQGGGLTGTALVAAARLGARAAYCGVLGDDELSRYAIQGLEREGVDCSAVLHRPEARPIHSTIIVDQSTGQRSILFSLAGVAERRPEDMTASLINDCHVLFVDHTVVAGSLRASELAHRQGIPVVGDVERETGPGAAELLGQIDHLIVGIEFAGRVTGARDPAAMVRALAMERACTVVTAGDRGCWYLEKDGEVRHFPAFKVRVVDTTGCGDVFHGAYAACLAQGVDIPAAIRVATAAAGLKVTRPGGRAGIPNRAQVERFLKEQTDGA